MNALTIDDYLFNFELERLTFGQLLTKPSHDTHYPQNDTSYNLNVSVLNFSSYKAYILYRIRSSPARGKGIKKEISKHLRVHTSLLSHILRGHKHLTPEQALPLAVFFKLNGFETEYFVELVNLERAGTDALKKYIQAKLSKIKLSTSGESKDAQTVDERVSARFYSSWTYTAIHLALMVSKYKTSDMIARRLDLPPDLVNEIIEFLLESGFLREVDGTFQVINSRTHLQAGSVFTTRHHSNWRVKAIERMTHFSEREFFYTSPMVISQKDALTIQALLRKSISDIDLMIRKSTPETLVCLNIDWFRI